MTIKEHIYRQLPSSLVSRMLLLTLLSIATAQFISTSIWYNFSKDQELDGLKNTAESMAQNIASTATFFNSLPLQYRHIVLEQLRDFGGSRYFVSLNEVEIAIDPVENSEMKRVVLDEFQRVLGNKLGNNIVIKNIPWNIIFMICGLGMLISLSAEVGVIDQIAIWIKDTASTTLLPYLVASASAFMSLFSSAMGVVMPTMFPIVPKIAAVGNEGLLFSLIAIFATLTGYSPFSSGGALVLAGVTDENERRSLFIKLIMLPFASFGLASLLIMFNVFIGSGA
jgi:hypothetical protein